MFGAMVSDRKADSTRDGRVLEAVLTLSVLESSKKNSHRQNDRFVVGSVVTVVVAHKTSVPQTYPPRPQHYHRSHSARSQHHGFLVEYYFAVELVGICLRNNFIARKVSDFPWLLDFQTSNIPTGKGNCRDPEGCVGFRLTVPNRRFRYTGLHRLECPSF